MVSTMKTLLLVPCADCRILKSKSLHPSWFMAISYICYKFVMECGPVADFCDFIQCCIPSNWEVCACFCDNVKIVKDNIQFPHRPGDSTATEVTKCRCNCSQVYVYFRGQKGKGMWLHLYWWRKLLWQIGCPEKHFFLNFAYTFKPVVRIGEESHQTFFFLKKL